MLHAMFKDRYTEERTALDLIAERIRALGMVARRTWAQFAALSSIIDDAGVPNAQEMIRNLVDGRQTIARTAREAFGAAEQAKDQPTCDLLTQRMDIHEKNAWMLRSLRA
ncbi:MAG: ferritin-like domain-containing protein [Burkholderiaceae bacterium]|nr:ferritin-like domain-containing protein [Burkholderiales bacterium]MCZ8340721.1 ferritin-like domain-containing protein [Burkholderiaceae bacterium]